MKAGPVVIGQILQQRARYKVPTYQRKYVWTKTEQWEPFWGDIRTKATERLAGREQRFSHYMGAVVLESRGGFSALQVPTSQVVDGQQRLTTFQLFLAAARDYARVIGYDSGVQTIERYLINSDPHLMADPDVELFKVWPSTNDSRTLFKMIIKEGRPALRKYYSAHFYAKKDKIYEYRSTPSMLAAYGYFYDRIAESVEKDALQEELIEAAVDEVLADFSEADPDDVLPREVKFNAIWQSLVEEFKVVEIVLEEGDDAQVIFETLNERGKPLLAADLVRNHIFQRADDEDRGRAEKLFEHYWSDFNQDWWSQEEKQGRYKKQRIEFFLANYIAAQIAADVTITKLFSEYKAFLKRAKFPDVEAELKELARFGAIYRKLVERRADDALGRFSSRLQPWDVTTVFPLAMQVWSKAELEDDEKSAMLETLLSFIVRRAVCGLTPKNYNKLFLAALADLNQQGWTRDNLLAFFLRQTAESGRWPRNDEFRRHWIAGPTYTTLGPARTRALLEELEAAKRTKFHETEGLKPGLTVEHVMPDSWSTNWPLSNGVKPTADQMTQAYFVVDEDDSVVGQIARRQRLKHNIGNLTLLTQPMNSKQSNAAWADKRAALQDPKYGSLLVINKEITAHETWSEADVENRNADLLCYAVKLWPIET